MRKDSKYNRLTWQRKESNGNHPQYTKELRRKMYEDGYWDKDDLIDCATSAAKEIVRTENRQKEAIDIMEAIAFFKYGKFREREPYIKALYTDGADYNGFTFNREGLVWFVWKSTDEYTQPQFKGDPLVKVVPDNVPIENIPAVLDAQPWTYL